jgi:AcrR family transcriptional regulator
LTEKEESAEINDKTQGYHHGDLAETLMEAALLHIAANGTEHLSLRALARESGVSATAPYRHFPSKQGLLAALATRGFRQLEKATRARLDTAMGLEDRFMSVGQAYVDYAVSNPTSYQLMFGSVLADFSAYEELKQASIDCYSVVLEILGELILERGLNLTAVELGGVVWAGVHGISSLLIYKDAIPIDDDDSGSTPQASLAFLRQSPEAALEILFRPLLAS